jgi:hypothetical protein
MAWVSPTGHNDPDSAWYTETNAYDEDVDTDTIAWSQDKWLELTLG